MFSKKTLSKLSKLVWVGAVALVASIVGGFISGIGSDLYVATKEWILSPLLPITIPQLLFLAIAIIGVGLIVYGLLRKPVPTTGKEMMEKPERVQAFIFFPEGIPNENLTLDYHQKYLHHKLMVDFKTTPPKAYPMPAPASDSWKLIQRYSDLWKSVLLPNSVLDDPNFEDKWCQEKRYERHEYSPSIEHLLKVDYNSKHGDAQKLIEMYSPIHAMIVRVNGKVSRETALKLTLGSWVQASLIDFNNISAIFKQHVSELGDDNLKMWLEIEKSIKETNGFYLGKREQEWFDRLDAEYNRLKNISGG